MVGRKEGVCDCGKDGDPGHGVTGKGGEERVVTLYKKEGREEDERARLRPL